MKKEIKIINFNSKQYWESINLRNNILRKPLGLSFSKRELLLEDSQIHFAYFKNHKIVAVLVLHLKDENTVKMRQVCVDNNF